MFILMALSIATGVLVGLLARGSVGNLARVEIRWVPVVLASVVVALLPLWLDLPYAPRQTIQILSNLGVLAFLLANLVRLPRPVRAGFVLLLLGWALNFVVITANGAMPVSRWALARTGQSVAEATPGRGGYYKVEFAGPGTVLRPLGDVIPAWPGVLSVGDCFLVLGILVTIASAMRGLPARA